MAKSRKTAQEKALEAKVDAIIKSAIQNVQIDIFDLGKISAEGMRAAEAWRSSALNESQDEAITRSVKAIIEKLRKN